MNAKPELRNSEKEFVPMHCACGYDGGQYLDHYGLVRCKCGKFYWALRPKRFGPLVAFPWPGDARMEKGRLAREQSAA